MIINYLALLALWMVLRIGNAADTNSIIFVAPPTENKWYYREFQTQLYDFYADFINKANSNDLDKNEYILALVDDYGKQQLLNRGIKESNIFVNDANSKLEDIWIRDFGTVQVDDTLYKFIYRPDYLTTFDAQRIDNAYIKWLNYNKVKYVNISIVLDGGNFVFERNTKKVIITERILDDNPLFNETAIIQYLKDMMNLNEIAIIPQERFEATGHADGMVTFINNDIIGINNYTKYTYNVALYNEIVNKLNSVFGKDNIQIIDLPYDPTWEAYGQFASAKGIYTNILTGLYSQYSPLYTEENGDDDLNMKLLGEYNANDVNVLGVNATDVAILGGTVNCLSSYIWGQPADDFIAQHNIVRA